MVFRKFALIALLSIFVVASILLGVFLIDFYNAPMIWPIESDRKMLSFLSSTPVVASIGVYVFLVLILLFSLRRAVWKSDKFGNDGRA